MLLLFLRYQLRTRQAYVFLFVLFLFFIRQSNHNDVGYYNPFIFIFLYTSYMFTNLVSYCKIPMPLLAITNARMTGVVRAFNITVFIWINLVELIIVGYNTYKIHTPLLTGLNDLLILNSTLFLGFIVGNRLSFSDLFTMKNRTLAILAAGFLFLIIILPFAGILSYLTRVWPVTAYVTLFLLAAFIVTWWLDSKRYKQLNSFFTFYYNK